MNIPELSHLQFLILDTIGPRRLTGRELRGLMAECGFKKSGPAFYQMMGRLEEAKFVSGEYVQKLIDGQPIKERVYQVTGAGEQAYNRTVSFYQARQGGELFA